MKTKYNYLIVLGLLLATSCSSKENNSADKESAEETEMVSDVVELSQKQMDAVGITLGKIEEKELGTNIRANGQISLNPQNLSDVSALLPGVVKKITVVEGQHISAGQTVAYIENTEIVQMQKDYLVACRETETAQQELKRQQALADAGAGIAKNLQLASASYQTALATQQGLARQLVQIGISPKQAGAGNISLQMPVKSLISGTVIKITATTGAYIDPTAPMMQVADNSAPFVLLNIFPKDLALVKIGQTVEMALTDNSGERLNGKVTQINSNVDPDTKAIAVHVSLNPGQKFSLAAGTNVVGSINTGQHLVPAVHDDAIVDIEGKKYFFVFQGNEQENGVDMYRFGRAEVITGVSELGYTQISLVKPLPEDAEVVTSNAFYLASMSADHGEH